MELFAHPVVAVVLLLGLLVFVHEAGHFLVGKACGIAVEIFSLGFGPILFSFQHKETNYRISIIPLGGFVKFYGSTRREDVPAELRGREFFRAPVWKRTLTVLAGPVANFLLAIVAYAGMVMYGIPQPPAIVGELMPGSPAEMAGLKFKDRIVAINGKPIHNWRELQSKVMAAANEPLKFTVERSGSTEDITIVPDKVKDEDVIGKKSRGQIGISPGHVPAIVTVTDPKGDAAEAGLVTGDKLQEMHWNGVSYPVEYWREFLIRLDEARSQGANTVTLKVASLLKLNAQSEVGSSREIQLPIGGLDTDDRREWPKLLGMQHSQMTIAEAEQGAEVNKPLQAGDVILAVDGQSVQNAFDFREAVLARQASTVPMSVLRGGEVLTLPIDMKPVEVQKAEGKVTMFTFPANFVGLLVQPEPVIEQHKNPFVAIWYGVKQTAAQTAMISVAVAGLFTGDMPLEALGGPISIAKVASDSVKLGWMSFFSALGLISVNLGLLNLFPIPVLDGGQLVLLGAEAVRRRPLNDLAIENFQKIGFIMVLALVAMATYNDLSRFWTSMLSGMAGIFQ